MADSVSSLSQNSWSELASMPTARTDLGTATVEGKIYAIGGGNYDGVLSTNEMYEPATDTWIPKAPMPTERSNFGIAVFQNKIYCIGGFVSDGVTNTNEVYDPETNTWETKMPMPTARGALEANVADEKIYLIGGSTGSERSTVALNEVYDPKTDSWSVELNLPTATQSYASAVVDNKIYLIGGYNYKLGMINLTQIYDLSTLLWGTGAPIPLSLYGYGAATKGIFAPEKIYVIGGSTGLPFDGNFIFDPLNNSWSEGMDMPTARNNAGIAIVDDILFVIGGDRSWYFTFLNTTEKYIPSGYGTIPPKITIISPIDGENYSGTISFDFLLSKNASWIGYSNDNEDLITILSNTTITGLPNGSHSIVVYANDTFGNMGTSQTVNFTVELPIGKSEINGSILIVVISISAVVATAVGMISYRRYRKTST